MAQTGLESFDRTLQDTHIWLNELMEALHTDDRQRAYQTLKAVLHGLRDRLTPEEAVQLGAQLPMLVRGFYYEGWRLSDVPVRVRSRDDFLEHMRDHLKEVYRQDPGFSVEQAVEAVFAVISRHVTAGEIGDVLQQLPTDVLDMWPREARSDAPGATPH